MLSFTGSLKVFVCLEAVDMRKGFEGLCAAVSDKLVSVNCSTLGRGLTWGESLKDRRAMRQSGRESAVGDAAPAPTLSA
jgi:hypothetical protein